MELTFLNRRGLPAIFAPPRVYIFPHPGLRGAVAHYTLQLAGPVPDHGKTLTLIPDASGCLIFQLEENLLTGRLYGPTTRTMVVENDFGTCPFRLYVECPPGGLYTLTGLPQWELADRVWPLEDTLPELMTAVARLFRRCADLDEFVYAVDRLLLSRLRFENPARGPLAALLAGETDLPAGYSPRHLSRLFREGAGMGRKSFLRVLRINTAVRRLSAGPVSLTRLAQELGYYDQSHFIHDFQSVCALSPTAYQARLGDFYHEPLKL